MTRLSALLPLLVVLVCGAGTGCDPIRDTKDLRTCEQEDDSIDCCSDSEQCVVYFGSEFPFCSTPGQTTGRCVECTTDSHCDNDSFCVLDSPTGPYCAPDGRGP